MPAPSPAVMASISPCLGLKWRSSPWYITLVVAGCLGTDSLVNSILVPVLPFQLERRGFGAVSVVVGWLLLAFSAGLLFSTIPVALLSEHYRVRTPPLVAGVLLLMGSQFLLLWAKKLWMMCLARFLQGISSSIVWVIGHALLCDNIPEQEIGRQLGFTMIAVVSGTLLGPPLGGVLFMRTGFAGPFIFGFAVATLDLIGRLLVIEQADAARYLKQDPLSPIQEWTGYAGNIFNAHPEIQKRSREHTTGEKQEAALVSDPVPVHGDRKSHVKISLLGLLARLSASSRAVAAFMVTLSYGLLSSSMEASLVVHLQRVWHTNSLVVGVILIGAVLPTIASTATAGWCANRVGAGWVTVTCLTLAIPWVAVMIVEKSLVLFLVSFAAMCFFTSAMLAPILVELTSIARAIEGAEYAHIYGIFNIAYGIGTMLGPIIGGELYDRLRYGWQAICLMTVGLLSFCLIVTFCATGEDPLLKKLLRKFRIFQAT